MKTRSAFFALLAPRFVRLLAQGPRPQVQVQVQDPSGEALWGRPQGPIRIPYITIGITPEIRIFGRAGGRAGQSRPGRVGLAGRGRGRRRLRPYRPEWGKIKSFFRHSIGI